MTDGAVAQCASMAALLRANRRDQQAANVEDAIRVTLALLVNEFGRETLSQAIDWAKLQLEVDIELPDLMVLHS